ncbi:unnamed protein product [Phytophthora fragariaefolia]|uniref:RxLR effector protein n=1 Tax=Phytophthora fragariaefolia TaxID=1490495 RepID=A0A9W7D791_9STRA|nr:unnamed protein product [Phytophthora fragariaefolia]
MRLALIFVVVAVATLNTSKASLASTKDSATVVESHAMVDSAAANVGGGRLLRRGGNGEDGIDEERGGFSFKNFPKWFGGRKTAKNTENTGPFKGMVETEGNHHKWLMETREKIYRDANVKVPIV